MSNFDLFCRSKKDKSKPGVKSETSDQEPEGLTLLVPDIQRTAEIVYAATTSLRQANQGKWAWIFAFHLLAVYKFSTRLR